MQSLERSRHAARQDAHVKTLGLSSLLSDLMSGSETENSEHEPLSGNFVARYARNQEREADRIGLELATQAGGEPFGLVGLETMAAGGVACTGSTGEDYVVPGQNALVLETADPWEFVTLFRELRVNPVRDRALRRAGRATAERYSWAHIVRRLLLPRLDLATHHGHSET